MQYLYQASQEYKLDTYKGELVCHPLGCAHAISLALTAEQLKTYQLLRTPSKGAHGAQIQAFMCPGALWQHEAPPAVPQPCQSCPRWLQSTFHALGQFSRMGNGVLSNDDV